MLLNQMSDPFLLDIESPRGKQRLPIRPDEASAPLTTLLRRKELPLNTRCGERGLCDGCLVELHRGHLQHLQTGVTVSAGVTPLMVRGCEYRLAGGEAALVVPGRSYLAHQPQIVSEFKLNIPWANAPLVQGEGLGAAVDIGTTTVAVLLVDLPTGDILEETSDFNQQVRFGEDVLTRIKLCSQDPKMIQQLRHAVVNETIEPLLRRALLEIKRPVSDLKCVTISGNTTMLHLFAGVDPTPMGTVPFTPTFLDHRVLHWENDFAETEIHLLPGAAAYVGADLTAGVLASGLLYDEGPSLLVDIGTNGEIIFKNGDKMLGCATAAGPAFEGAGLSCGMRGVDGAIERIRLTNEPFTLSLDKIGKDTAAAPLGICGSAYIDFLGEARRIGLLTENGRFEDLPGTQPHFIRDENDRLALRVARGKAGRDIIISEVDIACLLQAKAAIAAGLFTLLEREGISPADVKKVYLAGGFGMHLSVRHAIGCGLLPGFEPRQVEVIGNSSLAGAYVTLLDTNAMRELERFTPRVDVIELNREPNFEDHYIDQLSLP